MFMMWTSKPKGKVIRRPKPFHKQQCRAAAAEQQEKCDPHRDIRYFGFRHSDITRVFFVDSTNSHHQPSQCPPGPFEKKQTDITAYLEHVIPTHAFQPTSVNGQTRVQGKRNDLGDMRTCYPCRLPSACNHSISARSLSRRDATSANQSENVRPRTAPTGEMRRLSAANATTAAHTPALSSIRSGTSGTKRASASASKCGSLLMSRPGTRDSADLGSLQSTSRLMTGTSYFSGSRLQSVPE